MALLEPWVPSPWFEVGVSSGQARSGKREKRDALDPHGATFSTTVHVCGTCILSCGAPTPILS
jgi:hypothetical protein